MNDLAAHLIKEWEQDRFTVATEAEQHLASALVELHGLGSDSANWLYCLTTPPERDLALFIIDQLTNLDTTDDTHD